MCISHVGGHKRILLVRNPALLVRGLRPQSDTQLLVRDPVNVIQVETLSRHMIDEYKACGVGDQPHLEAVKF